MSDVGNEVPRDMLGETSVVWGWRFHAEKTHPHHSLTTPTVMSLSKSLLDSSSRKTHKGRALPVDDDVSPVWHLLLLPCRTCACFAVSFSVLPDK